MYEEEYPQYEPEKIVEVPVTVTVGWNDSQVVDRTVKNLTGKIMMDHKKEIERRVFAALDDLVNDLLKEVIEREVTLTDQWGKPRAEPTTIRALLQQSAEAWLTARVDRYGRTDSRSYSRDQTRTEYLFKEKMGKSLTAQVKTIISENIGDIDELISAEVKAQLRRTIK